MKITSVKYFIINFTHGFLWNSSFMFKFSPTSSSICGQLMKINVAHTFMRKKKKNTKICHCFLFCHKKKKNVKFSKNLILKQVVTKILFSRMFIFRYFIFYVFSIFYSLFCIFLYLLYVYNLYWFYFLYFIIFLIHFILYLFFILSLFYFIFIFYIFFIYFISILFIFYFLPNFAFKNILLS